MNALHTALTFLDECIMSNKSNDTNTSHRYLLIARVESSKAVRRQEKEGKRMQMWYCTNNVLTKSLHEPIFITLISAHDIISYKITRSIKIKRLTRIIQYL